MGKIKSALELAMEKTADLKVDKKVVKKNMLVREGKVSASSFLENPEKSDMKDRLKHYSGEEKSWFKSGAVETVLANLTLPQIEADLKKLDPLAEALIVLTGEKKETKSMFDQLRQLFKQFLTNIDQLDEQLQKQYEPQLRQKEIQLRKQTGQEVHLTADSDPDYMKILSEQYAHMEQQYNEVLKQAKDQIRNS